MVQRGFCKVKVLLLFGPDNYGGSFVIAEKIAHEYIDAGHEVVIVVKDPYSKELYKRQGFEVLSIQLMKRNISLVSDILASYKLMKLFDTLQCDVMHSHTSKGGFYSRVSKIFNKNINVIHTVHGYYKSENKLKTIVFDAIERWLLPLGDVTTFVNYEDYQNTKSNSSKLIYIPNGVDLPYFKCNRIFDEEIFRIIINARIVWEKGYRDVVTLIKSLSCYNIHFDIIGTGENELEVKQQLSGFNNVTCHGFVDDIRPILNKAHLNLLLSYREGLSLSILESMASGIPTIAYDIRGNRELIIDGYSGFLCEIYDVDKIKDRICFYYSNRTICEAHGSIAYLKVKDEYNAKETYKLYLEVLEQDFRKT